MKVAVPPARHSPHLARGGAGQESVLRRRQLSLRYLDALAAGFPLGMAVGRIGDVISGEHYGPATTVAWASRMTSMQL